MTRKMTYLVLVALLLGCSNPPTDDPGADANPKSATFWQLKDDSELNVRLSPWPIKNGKVTITAETGPGDWGPDKPIVEKVEYQVTSTEAAGSDWKDMGPAASKTEGSGEESYSIDTYTARDVSLAEGQYLHFKVSGPNLENFGLAPWKIGGHG